MDFAGRNGRYEANIVSTPHPCELYDKDAYGCCGICKHALLECNRHKEVTYYCSRGCQIVDLPQHRPECRRAEARLTLFHAAHLCDALLQVTRYAAFNAPVALVEKDRDSKGRLVVWKGHIMGKELVWKFRSGNFANGDDALLMATWLAGGTATIRMVALLYTCIEDIVEVFEDFNVTIADEKRRILVRSESGIEEPHRQHAAFRVKLKGDPTWYAVDLAGMQFGLESPITEWDDYVGRLGISSQQTKGMAWHVNQHNARETTRYQKLRYGVKVESCNAELRHLTQSYVSDRMYLAIEDWLSGEEITLADLVNQGRYELVEALGYYVLSEIEKFMSYIQLSGGIESLDQRVCVSVDERTEQNPDIFDADNTKISPPSGMIVRLYELRSGYRNSC